MRIHVIPIDFVGPELWPKEDWLHEKAERFCERELAEPLDFLKLAKVWVAVTEKNRRFQEVIGITGYCLKPDIPVFRVAGPNAARATKMLTDRLHSFFADQGMRHSEVFVHVSSNESPEQKCASWLQGLLATDAKPADRYSVIVR